MIPQYKPFVDRDSLAARIHEYILSDGYFTEFRHTSEFEAKLASYLKVKHCSVVNNGTISLSLALLAMGVGPGDRVLVPNITMIATSNAARLIGAVPVLIDVEPETLCMDLQQATVHLPTAMAVAYVTLNGRSHRASELRAFRETCDRLGVAVLQDNAQSLGSLHDDGTMVACLGARIGSFSFSMPKIITTGQGGCLVTDDDELARKISRLKDFGRARGGLDVHDEFGINSKFTEMQAIMGLEQMTSMDWRVTSKGVIWNAYRTFLADVEEVELVRNLEGVVPWFVDVYVDRRDELQAFLKDHGIGTRPVYPPLHSQIVNRDLNDGDFTVSSRFSSRGLWLPCSLDITVDEIEMICRRIKEFFNA